MTTKLENFVYGWKKPYIREQDLFALFEGRHTQRYDAVKYAIAKGLLVKIRRGLYLINFPHQKSYYDSFELAQVIYGPSYISLESALSYHGWIPERVYVTTSVTSRRSLPIVDTPIGQFTYLHTPHTSFYLHVKRIDATGSIFLIAKPWKAIADYVYTHKKEWRSINDLQLDLRIEDETISEADTSSLAEIVKYYDNNKVKRILNIFLKELRHGH